MPGTTSDLLSRWMRVAESAQQEADRLRADLAASRERIAALESALRWLLHLHHGVSKGGEDVAVTFAEWKAALKEAMATLGEEATDGE